MDYYDKNIQEIKKQGFESINFSGYGGIGYKKGDLEIWWHDWGYAYIELIRAGELIHKIDLCQISNEPISKKLEEALKKINCLQPKDKRRFNAVYY